MSRIPPALVLILTLLTFIDPSFGSEPKRLIRTSPTHQSWMSETEVMELGRQIHESQGHCGGFMDVTGRPEKKRQFLTPFDWIDGREPIFQARVSPLLREVNAENLKNTVQTLSGYTNRFYRSETGKRAAEWIRDHYRDLGAGRSDIRVELFRHSFLQPSVIARIEGARHPEETVILGAHLDSINWADWGGEQMVAPGADDDASGTAALIEAFRILAQSGFRPDRTIEFIGYAGEEAGLLGSQDIAQSYQEKGRNVVGVLQLDMTMYPGLEPSILLISDYTHPGLNRFMGALIDTYIHIPWHEMKCEYACSDHASWNELGYPATFPFEATEEERNHKIHTTEDRLGILDHLHGAHFARLALAFAIELSLEK